MYVRIEGSSITAFNHIALISLPEVQVLIAIEQADPAQLVRVPLPSEHGVGRQVVAVVLVGEEPELGVLWRIRHHHLGQFKEGFFIAPDQLLCCLGDPLLVVITGNL